jgi:hypothetical protein
MRNTLLVVILVATAACGAYSFPGSGNGSGTVSGQVTASGCGPVEQATPVCLAPQAPAPDCLPKTPDGTGCGTLPSAGVELVFTNAGTSLSASTDSNGDYSIKLAAGTWTVDTKPITRIISGPRTLTVDAGASIVANYVVDTGIRAATQ